MKSIKTNFKEIGILILILISFKAHGDEAIEIMPINVTGQSINEQSYISGDYLIDKLIKFNSIKSNNSGSLLDYFTGVNSAKNGGGSSMPVIRGLADDRIKIKVDGMDLIAACANHMNSPLSSITSSNVEQIKVFAGLTPVSFGGDSIGGSILINSSQPQFSENGETLSKNKLSTFFRSNNKSKSLNINSMIASENLSLNYNGSYIYAENFMTGKSFKESGNAASDREFIRGDEVGSSAFKDSNHMLTLGARKDDQLFNLKIGYQKTPAQGFSNQRMDSTKNEVIKINIAYENNYNWGKLEARMFNEKTQHSHNFGKDKKLAYSMKVEGMPMNAQGHNFGFNIKADILFSQKDLITIGSEFQRYRLNDWWTRSGTGPMSPNTFQNINNGERDRLDFYAEWMKVWTPDFNSSLGIRYGQVRSDSGTVHGYNENNSTGSTTHNQLNNSTAFNSSSRSKNDHNIDISLLGEYIVNNAQSYELGYARKTRSPNLYERYTWSTWMMAANMNNTYGDGNGYVGNINLNPETAHTVSFSSDWHDELMKYWSFIVTPYFTYVDDYIDAVSCSEVGKSCMSRSDGFSTLSLDNQAARIYGLDLSGYKSLTSIKGYGDIVLKGSFSYSRGKNTDANDSLYRLMPANTKLAVEQKFGNWNNRLEASLVKNKTNLSKIRNESETPGYGLINVFSTYSYKDAELSFGITNLFDKYYIDPLGGSYLGQGATMMTGVSNNQGVPGMGRSFNLGLTIDL
ncbi:TonB-dependent receptor [Methylophilaceae bacterium]|nr:TonB-dependent receptor [Methylophilaceae bacterium]